MQHRVCSVALVLFAFSALAQSLKTETFDTDPKWDSFNNRAPMKKLVAHQNFGYSDSNFAGKAKGEIGGNVQRSTVPAYYADAIAPKTLNDKLSASGTFAVPAKANGGVFFGWFNSNQQVGSGRPVGAFGLDIGFKKQGGHLSVHLITSHNQACGVLVTSLLKNTAKSIAKFGPPTKALHADGTRYSWKLDYDPNGAKGNGQIRFSIHSNSDKPLDFENKEFTVDVPPGYKQQGATFDRFGLINIMKTGGVIGIYFDDLTYNGKTEDFSKDPNWIGLRNRGEVAEEEQAGIQNFGYSKTANAGGKPGEIGGAFWRTEYGWGYYADQTARLTLDKKLVARGKVEMLVGAPDSNMYIGWFAVGSKDESPETSGNFLGISVGGPTRIGHYFAPAYTTAKGNRGRVKSAPIIVPGHKYDFSLEYDPVATLMTVKLGTNSVTLPIGPEAKSEGARFDHFGVLTAGPGGQMVKIFFDDLEYTAASN